MSVPLRFEAFATFGHALCADLFLFHFTLLPLRFLQSLVVALVAAAIWSLEGLDAAMSSKLLLKPLQPYVRPAINSSMAAIDGFAEWMRLPPFGRAQAYDLLKGSILILATVTLGWVQVSRVYHYIRGEAVIKLYVVYNVLSMGDALLSSLGQDIMDGLYRTARDALGQPSSNADGLPASVRHAADSKNASEEGALFDALFPNRPLLATGLLLAAQMAVAVAYVSLHACVIFIQIVCLNVAMNSRNNALLTLLVSNNFVELKGSVFKKYEPENLFQVACADAVERFTLSLYLTLIGLTELVSLPSLAALLPSIAVIWACELFIDYAKHSFAAKFNRLHSDLYGSFSAILAHDALAVRGRYATSLDPTHAPVRRLGLAALPLSCVVIRMAMAKIPSDWRPRVASPSGLAAWVLFAVGLFTSRLALNMLLLSHSASVVTKQKQRLLVSGTNPAVTTPALMVPQPASQSRSSTGSPLHSGEAAVDASGRKEAAGFVASTGGTSQSLKNEAKGRRCDGDPSYVQPHPHRSPASATGNVAALAGLCSSTHMGGIAGLASTRDLDAESEEEAALLERVSRTERYSMRGKGIPF